ncbi:unnamed protein product [Blepharisma stoltei]|uniref:Uncharacterized protein n=1 Tax=Blepharisma stoltei TaxID=1481888 RepID=A0AAU9JMM6_9CILI|nr:unnamed protein product [Blepharisma stoltei]
MATFTNELINQCLEVVGGQPHEIRESETSCNIHLFLPGAQGAQGLTRKITIEPKRSLVTIYSQNRNTRALTEDQKKYSLMFISKANELISFGNIEMNYDSGEFRYKTSQAFPGVRDPKPIIGFMLEMHNNIFPKLCEILPKAMSNPDPTETAPLLLRL